MEGKTEGRKRRNRREVNLWMGSRRDQVNDFTKKKKKSESVPTFLQSPSGRVQTGCLRLLSLSA